MIKDNLLPPLDKAIWEDMNGKAKWDSIVALRGPDLIGSDTIKFYTTSVIRHRLSKVMRVGGMVNQWLGFVVLPSGNLGLKDSKLDLTHFLQHVHEAADWLKIPIVWVKADAWSKLMLDPNSNYLKVGEKLLKYIDEGKERDGLSAYLKYNGYGPPEDL